MERLLVRLRAPGIAAALTLLIAPYVGMLWERIAPAPTYVNLGGEVYLNNQDSSEFVAADGWFLVLGLLVGILSAVVGYWRCRSDLGVILALGLAAVPAAYIAREVGEAFGPAPIQQTALTLADGSTIEGSITIGAHGVLFGWSVGVLITYLSLVGGLERTSDSDADEAAEGWEQEGWEVRDGALVSPNGSDGSTEIPAGGNAASVGAPGLPGDVGAGERRQVGEHGPLPPEKGELGP